MLDKDFSKLSVSTNWNGATMLARSHMNTGATTVFNEKARIEGVESVSTCMLKDAVATIDDIRVTDTKVSNFGLDIMVAEV